MTGIITKSTIESNAYDNVISLLNTRSIIIDPRDKAGNSGRDFIYDSDPLHKAVNFGDFPYIIAEFSKLEYSGVSVDGKIKNIQWSIPLTVRTSKDGASLSSNNLGRVDMFAICDNLQEVFNSMPHRQTLSDYNMHFVSLLKEDNDSIPISQHLVYQSTYTLTFTTRMVVSS